MSFFTVFIICTVALLGYFMHLYAQPENHHFRSMVKKTIYGFLMAICFCFYISPIDIWPDFLPGGNIDDMAYIAGGIMAYNKIQREKTKEVVLAHA